MLGLVGSMTAAIGAFDDTTGRSKNAALSPGPRPRRAPPPPLESRHVLEWAQGSWRCLKCAKRAHSDRAKAVLSRKFCRGGCSSHGRWKEASRVEQAPLEGPRRHKLSRIAHYTFCRACGSFLSARACGLLTACPKDPRDHNARTRRNRLLDGKHPYKNTRLPGEVVALSRSEELAFFEAIGIPAQSSPAAACPAEPGPSPGAASSSAGPI